jgi:hypothetical protein
MTSPSDHDDEAEAAEADEAQLAKLPPRDQQLVRQCMANHGLTLAEALDDLREIGAL